MDPALNASSGKENQRRGTPTWPPGKRTRSEGRAPMAPPLFLRDRTNGEDGLRDLGLFPEEEEEEAVLGGRTAPPCPGPWPAPFDALSDELVLHIFKLMPKCVLGQLLRVCRRFHRIGQDEVFWRRIDLGVRVVRPGTWATVVHRGALVLRMAKATIQAPVFWPPHTPAGLAAQLMYLDLSMANVDAPSLSHILQTCRRLRKLALEHLALSDAAWSAIGQNPQLQVLHLAMVQGVTPAGLRAVLDPCSQLAELNLAWAGLSPEAVDVLAAHLPPSLRRLNLAGCRETLKDAHVDCIVTRCPRLIEFDVSDALRLTPDAIESIVRAATLLESLSTSRCYGIHPAAYLALTECATLKYFNVYGVFKTFGLTELKERLVDIEVNQFLFSSIARPTVGQKRTSVWGLRVRD